MAVACPVPLWGLCITPWLHHNNDTESHDINCYVYDNINTIFIVDTPSDHGEKGSPSRFCLQCGVK